MINDVLSDSREKNQIHTYRNQSSEMKENTFKTSQVSDAVWFVMLDKLIRTSLNNYVLAGLPCFSPLFYVILKVSVPLFLAKRLCTILSS